MLWWRRSVAWHLWSFLPCGPYRFQWNCFLFAAESADNREQQLHTTGWRILHQHLVSTLAATVYRILALRVWLGNAWCLLNTDACGVSVFRSKKTIMDFSAEAIARQMTILDNELFQKVDVSMARDCYAFNQQYHIFYRMYRCVRCCIGPRNRARRRVRCSHSSHCTSTTSPSGQCVTATLWSVWSASCVPCVQD